MPADIRLVSAFDDQQQLAELYQAAALGNRTIEQIVTVFQTSQYRVFALENGKLIGAGRAFGDEVDCAVICDMAILPSHQGRGLGTRLLEHLTQQVKHHLRIILYAQPGKEGFYLQNGFHKMKTAMMTSFIVPIETGRSVGFIA